MNYWLKIGLCAVIFGLFVAFELGIRPMDGALIELAHAFFMIAVPFAALYLVVLLYQRNQPKGKK